MYLITNSQFHTPTHTVYYKSTAGLFLGQTAHHGIEKNSSLKRGFLHAVVDGLDKIENILGLGGNVDVLIEDAEIAKEIRNASDTTFSRLLHFDDSELWEQILTRKQQYVLNIVSSPGESEELERLWRNQHPNSGESSPALASYSRYQPY